MELGSSICYGVYLVTVGVATTPDDDQGVANDGYSRQQPYTEAQEEVAHEVLARAELVSWRFTLELVDVASQTAEPELIRNSGQDKQFPEQNYVNYCNQWFCDQYTSINHNFLSEMSSKRSKT